MTPHLDVERLALGRDEDMVISPLNAATPHPEEAIWEEVYVVLALLPWHDAPGRAFLAGFPAAPASTKRQVELI